MLSPPSGTTLKYPALQPDPGRPHCTASRERATTSDCCSFPECSTADFGLRDSERLNASITSTTNTKRLDPPWQPSSRSSLGIRPSTLHLGLTPASPSCQRGYAVLALRRRPPQPASATKARTCRGPCGRDAARCSRAAAPAAPRVACCTPGSWACPCRAPLVCRRRRRRRAARA